MEKGIVYLRAMELSDLERTYRWHTDPSLYESVCGAYRYVSKVSEEEWLKKRAEFSNNELTLAICLTETDEHIGNVFVRNIDWISRSCNSGGAMVGKFDNRSKGYIQAALILFLRHVFKDLGLNRVECHVLVENIASQRAMEKINYKREATLRQAYFKNGVCKDAYVYAILAKDFEELEVRLAEKAQAEASSI